MYREDEFDMKGLMKDSAVGNIREDNSQNIGCLRGCINSVQ